MKKKLAIQRTVYPEGYDKFTLNKWYAYISKQVLKITGKNTLAK